MIVLQAATGFGNWFILLMMIGLMFLMFYQNYKRDKQQKKFLKGLKKGDLVVLKSGLHARIAEVNERTIVVETMSGKLLFERAAVSMEYTQVAMLKDRK